MGIDFYQDTYLPEIMHSIGQSLLMPVIICVMALLVVALFFIGNIIVEYFTERRHFKQNRAGIVNEINDASFSDVDTAIKKSSLLRMQKATLLTAAYDMGLPAEDLFALAQMEVAKAEKHYKNRLAWTDTIARVAPLMGLMGTLIPLGPGIVALGQNDIATLSSSLMVAFDSTVCGLACAVLAVLVSKIRSGWYNDYMVVLEAVMSCVIEKAAIAREAGIELGSGYTGNAFKELLEQVRIAKSSASKTVNKEVGTETSDDSEKQLESILGAKAKQTAAENKIATPETSEEKAVKSETEFQKANEESAEH